LPPGLKSDDTTFAASPAYVDGSNVRFRLGRPQVIGGWEGVIPTLLNGVCRSVFDWTDNTNTLNIGLGHHQGLQLWQGGSLFDITPASGFTAGAIDGTGSSGYGTGAFGVGTYGSPSTTDYFPLTWSQAAFGQTLLASPRNQTIFQWSNNTASKAVAVTNAPSNVAYMLVARDFVFAFGTNQEVGGAFNPLCFRHSNLRDATGWATDITSGSTSREYVLPGGGRIVAARNFGRDVLCWTSHKLYYISYVGQIGQIWRVDEVGDKCGLIGPGAAVVVGSTAFWISPDRQFHAYTAGGAVTSLQCPVREDFAENLTASQSDKIVASSVAEFDEIRFDYPDGRDGFENSRYLAAHVPTLMSDPADAWYRGQMARTAMVDAGPAVSPIGVTAGGNVYWHERGTSADGAPLAWFITTADVYLDDNFVMLVRGFWPDIAEQLGAVMFDVTTKLYPQDPNPVAWPTLTVIPGQSQADFKCKGRLFRVKVSGNASPTRGRFGRLVFDAKASGKK
jgi:hypothetical protein